MQINAKGSSAESNHSAINEDSVTHICLCFDGNINKQVLLTAFSAAHSANGPLVVHFVCPQSAVPRFCDALKVLKERLHANSMRLFKSEIHVVDNEVFESLPSIGWLPKASCLRLIIASLLNPGLSRIIYLDSDIMVTADLCELYRIDLRGLPIAAVQDEGMRPCYCDCNGLNAGHYFNAGVLVIDMKQWSEPAQKALALFAKQGVRYPCLDQDVLNIVFKDNWLELDARWNLTEQKHPFASRWFELIWPNGRKKESLPPAVYHMTPLKPWYRCCTSQYRFTYRQIAHTLFEDGIAIVEDAPLVFRLISWLPRPLYLLTRLIWDINLSVKHFLQRAKLS